MRFLVYAIFYLPWGAIPCLGLTIFFAIRSYRYMGSANAVYPHEKWILICALCTVACVLIPILALGLLIWGAVALD